MGLILHPESKESPIIYAREKMGLGTSQGYANDLQGFETTLPKEAPGAQ